MHTSRLSQPVSSTDSVLTLRDFLLFIFRNKWIALVSAALFAALIGIIAEVVTPEYTASITVLPVTPSGNGIGLSSLSSAFSHFGGIASLAGINLGNTGGLKAEALATLKSRELTDKYIIKNNLMPILFSTAWSKRRNTWKITDTKNIPTLWDANQLFAHHVRTIRNDPKTGITTLTIRWNNPILAAKWANGLVALTNAYLRRQAITEANRDIEYLNREIATTSIVAVKSAIYTLMEDEIKNEMIAKGRTEFALHIIDPAVPPSHKSFPKPLLWTIGGALMGLVFGYIFAVIRETVILEQFD